MTVSGWIFMISSISIVLSLTSYCFYKVLSLSPEDAEEHLHAQLEIDTGDLDN